MSENQSRGIRDFSKYDSMETEELEQILRLDAEAPEGTESDTELLLYVMEVLARRRKNANITGKTAQEAWESFQENYMPAESTSERKQKRAPTLWRRRLTAAAAAIALVILIPLTVRALSWGDLWNIVARWAKETFSFVSGGNADFTEPSPSHEGEAASLQELLENSNRDASILPTWIPDGFVLERVEKEVSPIKETYTALYKNGDEPLRIQVQTYLSMDMQKTEISGEPVEVYSSNGIDFHLFENENQVRAIWKIDCYECLISGDLSVDEIKIMIDSIRKG